LTASQRKASLSLLNKKRGGMVRWRTTRCATADRQTDMVPCGFIPDDIRHAYLLYTFWTDRNITLTSGDRTGRLPRSSLLSQSGSHSCMPHFHSPSGLMNRHIHQYIYLYTYQPPPNVRACDVVCLMLVVCLWCCAFASGSFPLVFMFLCNGDTYHPVEGR